MRIKSILRCVAVCMAIMMAIMPVNAEAASLLKRGSKGSDVKMVQTTLKELGYYTYSKATGYYGKITETAVKHFQKDNGIYPDGIIGKKTRGVLFSDKTASTGSRKATAVSGAAIMSTSTASTSNYRGDLDWFKEVRDLWKRGMNAVVTDIETGKSFEVKRTYGTNHADVEPLTKEDTAIIKEIWGGFSWKRRAVVVQLGEYTIAGSMTAMPHAGLDSAPANKYVSNRSQGYGRGINLDAVKSNGCNGVMDLHFKNSRTHTSNTKQESMQTMVEKAADYIETLNVK